MGQNFSRHIILISNPGNPSDKNYTKSVEKAILRWKEFLCSKIGGFWNEKSEITEFNENNTITPNRFELVIDQLNKLSEYSIIVFCGHGGCTIDGYEVIQLPIPNNTENRLYPVWKLLGKDINGKFQREIKRTVIIDACRGIIPFTYQHLFEQRQFSAIAQLDGDECAAYYNDIISNCDSHVELLQSTTLRNVAYDSQNGSRYTDAMSRLLKSKENLWATNAYTNSTGHFTYSMKEFYDDLAKDNELTEIQNPTYWSNIVKTHSFPFVAYHVPIVKTLDQIIGEIKIIDD